MASRTGQTGTMRIDLIPDIPVRPAGRRYAPVVVVRKDEKPALPKFRFRSSATSRDRFASLLECIYDAVLITNEAGIIENANARAQQFFRSGDEGLSGLSVVEMVAGADLLLLKTVQDNLDRERFTLLMAHCRRRDGSYFPTEIAVNRFDGDEKRYCFFIRDITVRRQAEEMLRTEHNAIQHAANGIAVATADLVFEYVNPAFARLLEHADPERLTGKFMREVFNDNAMLDDMAAAVLEQGVAWKREFTSRLPSGRRLELDLLATCNRNSDGDIVGVIFSVVDLSDRKRAEAAARDQARVEMLSRVVEGTIKAMSLAVESRDPYTAGHEQNVADLAAEIARKLEYSECRVKAVYYAALVHDLGKISVPAEILSAPGRLCAEALGLVRKHAHTGYSILKYVEFPWPIAEMVYQHHERMDGSGYPRGLAGEDILPEARILAVADVVEAMTNHRPYRASLGEDLALEEIEKHRGTLYDPDVVDVCLDLFRRQGFKFKPPLGWVHGV